MTEITIKNVGPIKEISLSLNKINIFMGPQSSGKSTIAKIISHFTWLEKDLITKPFSLDKNIIENILNFHQWQGYFNEKSFISYKGDVLYIEFSINQGIHIKNYNKFGYKRSKISYIPSQRNVIVLPDIKKLELGNTNLRSFLFDWYDARTIYNKDNKLSLLNLGINYYYNKDIDQDYIQANNNSEYNISLSNASSGLQSIIPLITLIEYIANGVYNEENKSFELRQKEIATNNLVYDAKVLKPYFGEKTIIKDEQERNKYREIINNKLSEGDSKVKEYYDEYLKVSNNLLKTQNTQLIIEEPEQNLFPTTQKELVYYLINKCLNKQDNKLTITTHSPYILYALNNCMLHYLVKDKIGKDDNINCPYINPSEVSVWEIKEGEIRNIQQEDNLIEDNYFDKSMKEIMNDFYNMINYYE
ncbi:MAG: AAA family ATPase [Bacteroidales bacterium]|jgi:energy-coupling factor transporter ATP-binding protein EcfA2|nr:AAA family ATPase [Bacteroidales bacterium]